MAGRTVLARYSITASINSPAAGVCSGMLAPPTQLSSCRRLSVLGDPSVAQLELLDLARRGHRQLVHLDEVARNLVAGERVPELLTHCLLYTSPSPRDGLLSRM